MNKADKKKAEALKSYLAGLPEPARQAAKDALRLHLFKHNIVTWAQRALQIDLTDWQKSIVTAQPGSRTIALCSRQSGKSTSTAVAIAHTAIFEPGTLSVVLSPTARQSSEMLRRVRGFLLTAGARLKADNAFSIETEAGSRIMGLPGSSDASIRGVSCSGVLAIDEAARVESELIFASIPMTHRFRQQARIYLLSTPWTCDSDNYFWRVWSEGDDEWRRIKATIYDGVLTEPEIEAERRLVPEAVWRREFMCEFMDGAENKTFNRAAIAAAFGLSSAEYPTPAPDEEDPVTFIGKTFKYRIGA